MFRQVEFALRRSLRTLLYAVNAIWAIPVVLVIRMARPWVTVRTAVFFPGRIGHFVYDSAVFLARKSLKPPTERTLDLFALPGKTANDQWARMVRRQLYARGWVRYLAAFNRIVPGAGPHLLELPSWLHRSEFDAVRKSSARFTFSPEEEEAARNWLRARGWREGERFVCLLVRDSAYLSGPQRHATVKGSYEHHNYRDSNITTYVDAVGTLVEKGYWVIRMGQVAEAPFPTVHPRIIDYPFATDRNDLLDIWLSVNCNLFVSTAAGIDMIPWVYRGPPLVYVNANPLFFCSTPINQIWVPKHLRWKGTGKLLTFREHCNNPFTTVDEYNEAGIVIEDLSGPEIAAAVLEGEQRLMGTWVESSENKARQDRAWDVFRSTPDFAKYHSYIHPDARFGSAWLEAMGDRFLD